MKTEELQEQNQIDLEPFTKHWKMIQNYLKKHLKFYWVWYTLNLKPLKNWRYLSKRILVIYTMK